MDIKSDYKNQIPIENIVQAKGGPRLPIAQALHLLSTQELRFGGWRGPFFLA